MDSQVSEPENDARFLYPVAWTLTAFILLTFLTLGSLAQSLHFSLGIWFSEFFIFFGIPWVGLRLLGIVPASFTRLTPFGLKQLRLGMFLGVTNFFAFIVPLQFLSRAIFPEWMVQLFDSSKLFENQSTSDLILLILGVGIAAPVCEEFFFRGFLQQSLTSKLSSAKAIILTSLIFSAFHLDPIGFLARLQLGAFFGFLFFHRHSLATAIGAHAANNFVSIGLYFLFRGAAPAESEAEGWQVLLFSALGLLAMFLLWNRVYRLEVLPMPASALRIERTERRPFLKEVKPWLWAATLGLVALVAFDVRNLHMFFIDRRHPVPAERRQESDVLRRRAQQGEISLKEYESARENLARPTDLAP